jgi:hypothetical protein
MFHKGAKVLVTSALLAPGEGHSRVGRKNLPRIRSSEITSTRYTPYLDTNISLHLAIISCFGGGFIFFSMTREDRGK